MKPNAVLFRLETGNCCIVIKNENGWDWENVKVLYQEAFQDLSYENPFEFIFCNVDSTDDIKIITMNQKSSIPDTCFTKLYNSDMFIKIIESDYNRQFEQNSYESNSGDVKE